MEGLERIYKEIGHGRGMLYSWFTAMHTRIDIALCGPAENDLIAITGKVSDRISQLEKTANFFDPESELAILNKIQPGMNTEVSDDLLSMLYLSMKYNDMTGGAFDVCIKSDGYKGPMAENVGIDLINSLVTKYRHGIRFDLSGFLKGYALDEVKKILGRYGVEDALVSIGNSSVLALGNHPFGEGWSVTYPGGDENNIEAVLHDQCLTTSGNSDSQRRHIIDPASDMLIEGEGRVSVVTQGGGEGEALATAMFVVREQERRATIVNRFHGGHLLDVR